MEMTFSENKKKEMALEMQMKQTNQMMVSVRSERNILRKNLNTANVRHLGTMPFYH